MLTGSLVDFYDSSMIKLRANPKLFTASHLKQDKLFNFNTIEHDEKTKDEPVALDDVVIINNSWYFISWRHQTLKNHYILQTKYTTNRIQQIKDKENKELKETVTKLKEKLQVTFVCVFVFLSMLNKNIKILKQ